MLVNTSTPHPYGLGWAVSKDTLFYAKYHLPCFLLDFKYITKKYNNESL